MGTDIKFVEKKKQLIHMKSLPRIMALAMLLSFSVLVHAQGSLLEIQKRNLSYARYISAVVKFQDSWSGIPMITESLSLPEYLERNLVKKNKDGSVRVSLFQSYYYPHGYYGDLHRYFNYEELPDLRDIQLSVPTKPGYNSYNVCSAIVTSSAITICGDDSKLKYCSFADDPEMGGIPAEPGDPNLEECCCGVTSKRIVGDRDVNITLKSQPKKFTMKIAFKDKVLTCPATFTHTHRKYHEGGGMGSYRVSRGSAFSKPSYEDYQYEEHCRATINIDQLLKDNGWTKVDFCRYLLAREPLRSIKMCDDKSYMQVHIISHYALVRAVVEKLVGLDQMEKILDDDIQKHKEQALKEQQEALAHLQKCSTTLDSLQSCIQEITDNEKENKAGYLEKIKSIREAMVALHDDKFPKDQQINAMYDKAWKKVEGWSLTKELISLAETSDDLTESRRILNKHAAAYGKPHALLFLRNAMVSLENRGATLETLERHMNLGLEYASERKDLWDLHLLLWVCGQYRKDVPTINKCYEWFCNNLDDNRSLYTVYDMYGVTLLKIDENDLALTHWKKIKKKYFKEMPEGKFYIQLKEKGLVK